MVFLGYDLHPPFLRDTLSTEPLHYTKTMGIPFNEMGRHGVKGFSSYC